MDIKNKFREEILLHESELILEGKIDDIVQRIIDFLKKNAKKIGTKLNSRIDIAKAIIQKLRKAGSDFRAGKLDRKNPNYDEQARRDAVDTVKDLAKLLSFFGMNIALNTFIPLLGVGAGGLVMLFRKLGPDKIADFLTLAIEKGRETISEMLGLLEDMAYYHVDDATQDEFKLGL